MTINIRNSDETQTTINYFRSDKLFRGKNISGTNLRKLFTGLAVEIARAENKLQEVSDEYDPQKTVKLLTEWEHAIGIPDHCIPLMQSNDNRRNNILLKLRSLGVSTKEGFEDLALLLGFVVQVFPGQDTLVFPFTFPFILINENPRWVMYVTGPSINPTYFFPFTFPFIFGEDTTLILRCLFQALVPTPVKVIFNFTS